MNCLLSVPADVYFEVKNDHRSKFSNLSNWEEEAWKHQGFNGIRTRDLRDTGALLYQLSYEATQIGLAPNVFFPIAQIGKFAAMIILHFDLQPQFKYMNCFIYTSHHNYILC